MNKELYVSTTPHETKVGITEDDQLAEIYLERENEYTLAGSIYKGRVTRVLPGMQSAFVDIGLERDAFLYVSDFMDLEQQDEDLDEAIPANRPVAESRPHNGQESLPPALEAHGDEGPGGAGGGEQALAPSSASSGNGSASRDFRGRRRRRGRRGETGRGERPEGGEIRTESAVETPSETHNEPQRELRTEPRNEPRADRFNRGDRSGRGRSDSRFQRPAPTAPRTGRDYDYGPPPGYQPILLPGESISKYQKQSDGQPRSQTPPQENTAATERPSSASIVASFPDDEPIFASKITEPLNEQHEHVSDAAVEEDVRGDVYGASRYQRNESSELAEESAARERVKHALMTSETIEQESAAAAQSIGSEAQKRGRNIRSGVSSE